LALAAVSATGIVTIGAALALASGQVSESLSLPVRAVIDTEAVQCDNTGSTVNIGGHIYVDGFGVRLLFRNNTKGTHEGELQSTAGLLVSADREIWLPKSPARGGVGGNPFINLQLEDGNGKALSEEIYLGRCVQGLQLNHVDRTVSLPALARLAAQAVSCDNRGSTINVTGSRSNSGLRADLIFRNNNNPVGGPHSSTEEARVSIDLLLGGQELKKSPSMGGAGGNPRISAMFTNGNGDPVTGEYYLGRCSTLR
jgi:hypothetical protein